MTIYEDYVLKKVKKDPLSEDSTHLQMKMKKIILRLGFPSKVKKKIFCIMNKLKNDNLLNALCLHDIDNILITLKNLNSGMVLNEYGITIDSPALSGQKIARFDIQKDDQSLNMELLLDLQIQI